MYKKFIHSILFLFPTEATHNFICRLIKFSCFVPGVGSILRSMYVVKDKRLERQVFGLTFSNPVGLAAGFDKNAHLFDELANFGFGFIEVGTVTPKPQAGNPKPRMFRLRQDKALINRMGFNNDGVEAVAENLKRRKTGVIVGGNIGKNKITPNAEAINDYEKCFLYLFPYVDYFAVNVSSPNTPGLRALQEREPLTKLLLRLKELNLKNKNPKPILLKIAPDLTNTELDDIIDIVKETKIDGIIATNTTIDRSNLHTDKGKVDAIGAGGLSGAPLRARSTEVIKYLSTKLGKEFPIIAVGGIFTGADAIEKLNAGASLLQVYTGFIYEGPSIAKCINQEILKQA
jgi:dihydroorotate dehydrogenase